MPGATDDGMFGALKDSVELDRLLQVVRDNRLLCLDVVKPGWVNARGYLKIPASLLTVRPEPPSGRIMAR